MKKTFFVIVIGGLLAATAALGDEVKGVVQSINAATNEVMVAQSDGAVKKVVVPAKVTPQMKAGSAIKVTTKSSSNVAQSVELEIR